MDSLHTPSLRHPPEGKKCTDFSSLEHARYLLFGLTTVLIVLATKHYMKPSVGPNLPTITVSCGQVTLLLRRASQWTLGNIEFRGHPMTTTERSAYGTVFYIPECGFIGTGHLENEPESLDSLNFILDEKTLIKPSSKLKGDCFRLERKTHVRDLALVCTTELKNERLYETTTIRAAKEVPLKLLYHFMHAWCPNVSAYCAGQDAKPDKLVSGPLNDVEDLHKFVINQKMDWVAVYEPKSRQFAVSRLLAEPEQGGSISMIWNVPGRYRKFYLKCFDNSTVPAGFQGTWRMVTGFGGCSPENWHEAARTLANKLLN
jgi:hypothetical protein